MGACLNNENPELPNEVHQKRDTDDKASNFESVRDVNFLSDEYQVLVNFMPLMLILVRVTLSHFNVVSNELVKEPLSQIVLNVFYSVGF